MKRIKHSYNMQAERRVTRSLLSAKMDFIPQLPKEIGHLIFEQLTAKELAVCLGVSLKWRELANINHLWKRHCLSYGLQNDEDKKFQRNGRCDLCKWAQIWFSFRRSAAFGWRSKTWKTREIDDTNMFMRNTTDGESLVVCTGSLLTVRKIAEFGKIKYSLRIPLPDIGSSCLAVDKRYVAVAKCNVVLIYKIGINRYNCCMAVAMHGDKILRTRKYISRFIKTNIRTTPCVCILALSSGCIWLREHGRYRTFIINIVTERVQQFDANFYRFMTKTYIVSWSKRKVSVDTYKGRNILKVNRDVNKARANHHLLVTYGFTTGSNEDIRQVMETWDLNTGERLLCIARPRNAFFEIHPSKDILYQIEGDRDFITSLCPITGKEFWSVGVPNLGNIVDWCLRVVCGRYLVLFQYKSSAGGQSVIYVYDALCGQFMYKTERPSGQLEHLSDNIIIVRSSDKIYLRTFL